MGFFSDLGNKIKATWQSVKYRFNVMAFNWRTGLGKLALMNPEVSEKPGFFSFKLNTLKERNRHESYASRRTDRHRIVELFESEYLKEKPDQDLLRLAFDAYIKSFKSDVSNVIRRMNLVRYDVQGQFVGYHPILLQAYEHFNRWLALASQKSDLHWVNKIVQDYTRQIQSTMPENTHGLPLLLNTEQVVEKPKTEDVKPRDEVKHLLKQKIKDDERCPLIEDPNKVKTVITPANITFTDQFCQSLWIAIEHGYCDLVAFLLSMNANIYKQRSLSGQVVKVGLAHEANPELKIMRFSRDSNPFLAKSHVYLANYFQSIYGQSAYLSDGTINQHVEGMKYQNRDAKLASYYDAELSIWAMIQQFFPRYPDEDIKPNVLKAQNWTAKEIEVILTLNQVYRNPHTTSLNEFLKNLPEDTKTTLYRVLRMRSWKSRYDLIQKAEDQAQAKSLFQKSIVYDVLINNEHAFKFLKDNHEDKPLEIINDLEMLNKLHASIDTLQHDFPTQDIIEGSILNTRLTELNASISELRNHRDKFAGVEKAFGGLMHELGFKAYGCTDDVIDMGMRWSGWRR